MLPLEILVHVSAPSGGKDDARYRTEARSFLNFEPAERHCLSTPNIIGGEDAEKKASSTAKSDIPGVPRTGDGNDRQITIGSVFGRGEPSRFAEGICMIQASPPEDIHGNDSLQSRQDAERSLKWDKDVSGGSKHAKNNIERTYRQPGHLSSPRDDAELRLARLQDCFRHTPSQQAIDATGSVKRKPPGRRDDILGKPSSTPSAILTNDASALQLTSVKETPRLLVERTPALPRPRTAPTAATPSQRAPPLRRTQSDSWQTPPSTIPDSQPNASSYNLPTITSSPCHKRPLPSSSPSPTRPSPQVAKKSRIQIPSSPPTKLPASRSSPLSAIPSSLPASPTSSPPPPPTHISSSPPLSTPNTNPLEIHPPRPKPSTARFATHLTSSLKNHTALLAASYPKLKRTQTRTLDTLERGHWLVPFSGQDLAFHTDLWEFLNSYISSGRAGWGVWAVREEVIGTHDENQVGDNSSKDAVPTEKQIEEVLKVFCWGEVVAEVWLIMYMGGKRKIKGLGSRWIDARGEAVVVME